MSKMIVSEYHGGNIYAYNENGGAVFVIKILQEDTK
jgi:hypothetical protein